VRGNDEIAPKAVVLTTVFEIRLEQGYSGFDNPVTKPLLDGVPFVHVGDLARLR
jgi:hypothetical protein